MSGTVYCGLVSLNVQLSLEPLVGTTLLSHLLPAVYPTEMGDIYPEGKRKPNWSALFPSP